MLGWSYMCLTRVLFSEGDMAGAEEIIQKIENLVRESDLTSLGHKPDGSLASANMAGARRLDEAFQWMRKRKLDPNAEPSRYVWRARVHRAHSDPDCARAVG